MIKNPILPGFNPDPCVCRKGTDYYLAVSSFEWMPGIPVYHSKDLKNWELFTNILTDDHTPDLRNLPSAKGIWAPCLTYCAAEDLFYLVYGVMRSTNARYFDVDNYLITARDIRGPWSDPVYLHSAGFDASLFHDEDGRKWLLSLEWETRDGYEKPGAICLVEYLPEKHSIAGYPKRIWSGGTNRGCLEAPHLYKHDGRYYLLCAEGGTGYYHCVTAARASSVDGPYEGDPENPILTSAPETVDERQDIDHLKPRYYNPDAPLQKAGHGSLTETPDGTPYLLHLAARPFVIDAASDAPDALRCCLGRETALQKMTWTKDGWLRLAGGGNLVRLEVPEPDLPEVPLPDLPDFDDFTSDQPGNFYYAPRITPSRFVDLKTRPGYARLRGQESLSSLHQVSLLARKLTSVQAQITTRMEFTPKVYQHSAGLVLYYDNMNYLFLCKQYDQSLDGSVLALIRVENGVKTEFPKARVAVSDKSVYLRVTIRERDTRFSWLSGTADPDSPADWRRIGPVFDTSLLSDEYCKYGEFTGTMVGLACVDSLLHCHCADFDFFEYLADPAAAVK